MGGVILETGGGSAGDWAPFPVASLWSTGISGVPPLVEVGVGREGEGGCGGGYEGARGCSDRGGVG